MINKLLGYLSLLGLVISLLMSTLYLTTRSELKSLESIHTQLKQALEECNEAKVKQKENIKSNESISVEKEEQLSSLRDQSEQYLSELNKLRNKKCPAIGNNNAENTEQLSLDSELPTELTGLLESAYQNRKGNTDPPSR